MYDLTIIGAGWAGFNAALRAKSLGMKVALVEESFIGGTCLNQGCIPTKTLVQSAKIFEEIKKAGNFGISIGVEPQLNFLEVNSRKEKIIQLLRKGMENRLSGIEYICGHARLLDNQRIKVNDREIQSSKILLSLGSIPLELPGFGFDGKKIISSDQILKLDKIPGSLLIIGGGVIGCEFAQIYSCFGTKVTVVELMDQLLPGVDREIAKKLETVFKKKKISVFTSTDAKTKDLNNFELVLVCVGRSPRTEGLDALGIAAGKSGIIVDDYLHTSVENVYAAGDCVGKLMLAHYAGFQGVCAVENIKSPDAPRKAENQAVPACIFTSPEIAFVGLNEEQAGSKNFRVKVNKFDFLGSGMARIQDEAEGFIKIISDAESGLLLGAQIIGPKATELISIFGVSLSSGLSVKDLKKTIFAHPSLSEAIFEALD
ncbi:MAG: dihydrolipoyl dehydrogenase [Candidatus Omnitrophica bacterium]|nr:dihydrolipoyl dehydrogenase [Candidatus Omnitrophota bacterium]